MTSLLRRAVCAGTIFLSFLVLISAPSHHAVRAANPDARQRGATVFQTRGCERCHSILGVGGDRAPDLGSVGHRKTASQIKTQVVNGGHGMPPFGKVLSTDEVKDVVAFLASCKTEEAPGCRQWMQAEPDQGQSQ
jgi:mono/diheme cytochrome c family protein